MRLRGIHIALFVIVAVSALVAYGYYRMNHAGVRANTPEKDFLNQVREVAGTEPPTVGEGDLPPVQADPSLIPVLQVEPSGVMDMGTIPHDTITTHDLKVRNNGKTNLVISRLHTSCGCTKAVIEEEQKTVRPGATSIIKVSVDPKRVPGFESRKVLTIFSNDPAQPKLSMDVVAKIDPEFVLEPASLDFGVVKKGGTAEKTLLLRQLSSEPLEVLKVGGTTAAEDVLFTFEKRPPEQWLKPDHAEYTVTARISEEATPGPLTGRFIITTNCKRIPAYYCMMTADIQSFYTIKPARRPLIARSTPLAGQEHAAEATIEGQRPIEILDLLPSSPDLEVQTAPGDSPNAVKIKVALKPDLPPGNKRETIRFTVKSGDEAVKDHIPVSVFISTPVVR